MIFTIRKINLSALSQYSHTVKGNTVYIEEETYRKALKVQRHVSGVHKRSYFEAHFTTFTTLVQKILWHK